MRELSEKARPKICQYPVIPAKRSASRNPAPYRFKIGIHMVQNRSEQKSQLSFESENLDLRSRLPNQSVYGALCVLAVRLLGCSCTQPLTKPSFAADWAAGPLDPK